MPRCPSVGASEEGSVESPISRGNGSTGHPTMPARTTMTTTTTAWCSTVAMGDGEPTVAARGVETPVGDGIERDRTAEVRIATVEVDTTTRNEGATGATSGGNDGGISYVRPGGMSSIQGLFSSF